MDPLIAALEAVSPLSTETAARPEMRCKICGGADIRDFDLVDANKICSATEPYAFGISGVGVRYVRCGTCEFVFTTVFDAWDRERFARRIYNDDYIKIDGDYVEARPRRSAEAVAPLLRGVPASRILDYGSGTGVFSDEMARRGVPGVMNYDPYSHPTRPAGAFDVVTCIETIEHSPDPIATLSDIRSLLAPHGAALIGTSFQPPDIDELRGRWWYIAPRNAHISIFSYPALDEAARRAGLALHRGDNGFALLSYAGAGPASRPLLAALGGGGAIRYTRPTRPAKSEDAVTSAAAWFDAAIGAAVDEILRRRPNLWRSGLGWFVRLVSPGRSSRACAEAAHISGQWARAARFYADALIAEPGTAELWIQFAEMLERAGRPDEAALARGRAATLRRRAGREPG